MGIGVPLGVIKDVLELDSADGCTTLLLLLLLLLLSRVSRVQLCATP